MKHRPIAVVSLCCAVTLACSQPDPNDLPIKDTRYLISNRDECLAAGGRWPTNMADQGRFCTVLTTDANQACNDHSECQSWCVVYDESAILPFRDEGKVGNCYSTFTPISGCFGGVANGVAGAITCID